MRRITESGAILDAIAAATGASRERVAVVVTALRDAIDGLFLDGYSIFAPPFSITYRDDPVAPIFAERIDSATEEDAEPWRVGNMEATAEWLGVPLTTYVRHPVASPLMVLVELFDGLDIEDADSPEGAEAVAIAEAWFDTFEEERPYRLGNVGLERDLEAWLIHHPERLGVIGYDVRLRKQQLVLPDRRRPDLVFDLIEQDGSTGTLIVELKATGGYLEAVDQLVGYMDAFASLGLVEGVLRGLLIADGFPPSVLPYADEKGIDTATLSELGYRRDLAAVTTAKPSPRTGGTESETSMTKFIGLSVNQHAEGNKGTPVIVLYAKSVDDPPESIEPYGDSLEARETAAHWSSFIAGPGKDHTVAQLAMSLGGITYADDSPDGPDDLGVAAMQAAADFVRAAWEIRKDITYVPPRGLADWLETTPEELRGDDELPEHIHAAADALEGLPDAILGGDVPDYYDGDAGDFLRDAERIFSSVAERLRRITPLLVMTES